MEESPWHPIPVAQPLKQTMHIIYIIVNHEFKELLLITTARGRGGLLSCNNSESCHGLTILYHSYLFGQSKRQNKKRRYCCFEGGNNVQLMQWGSFQTTDNKISEFHSLSAAFKQISGDWAMLSSEVSKTRLYTPIHNYPCQFFIHKWSNYLQRKLCTSKNKKKDFHSNSIQRLIWYITLYHNYLCISLYFVNKKIFFVPFKLSSSVPLTLTSVTWFIPC